MPLDGSGTYTLPAAYLAVNGTTIQATTHNTPLEDIQTALTACIKANGSKAFTAEQLVHGNPSNALGIAPKQYVDAQVAAAISVAGLTVKAPVLLCTTGNVTLSGEQTIDGTLTNASRVLVAFQTTGSENGIYVTGAGSWARATDMDTWAEVVDAIVPVTSGTTWADTLWRCTNNSGGTLGSTAITLRRADSSIRRRADTTTSATIGVADLGCLVTTSNASAVAVTVPQATGNFGVGFWFVHQNIGAGTATDTPTTSTVNGAASLTVKTNDAYLWVSDGTNWRAIPLGLTVDQAAATKWPLGHLSGLTLSRSGTTTFGIATGVCANEDGGTQFDMTLSSAFTKTLSSFTAGTGNGALDTGAIGADSWYHVHLIRNTSTGAIDVLLSLSATSPTMPSGYVARRRIGSIRTNGSSQIVAFSQVGDEFLWDAAVIDADAANPGTAAVSRTVTTPLGVKTIAILSVGVCAGSNNPGAVVSSLDVSDQAAQSVATASLTGFNSATGQGTAASGWSFTNQNVRTNTSSQVRTRLSVSGANDRIALVTRGWIDTRGKN